MAYACQMTDDRAPAERTLSAEQRRQLAVDLCNHVWMLLGTPGRSPEADDEMIHAALIGSPELPRPAADAPPTLRVVGTTRAVVTRAGATAHVSVRFWVSEPARLQVRVTPLRSRRAFALLPGTTFAGSRSTTTRPTATTTVPRRGAYILRARLPAARLVHGRSYLVRLTAVYMGGQRRSLTIRVQA